MRATEPRRRLILLSPLPGWSTPLDEIPDPVFAGRMLGDGLAVDPTGATLHAPCDGEIIALPQSRHAVTLRSDGGAEILMHIGIDTVGLGGNGFEAHVQVGRRVAAGERLITFDLDLIARGAKSLLTPILVLEGCGFAVVRATGNREIAVGDVLMEIAPITQQDGRSGTDQPQSAGAREEKVELRQVRVALEHGIHARPAAQIVSALKKLAGEVSLSAQGRSVNARSTVALMKLGVRKGDEVQVRAVGRDAASAIDAVAVLLTSAAAAKAGAPEAAGPTSVQPAAASPGMEVRAGAALAGVIASRGIAVGQAVRLAVREIEVTQAGTGIRQETLQLDRARAQIRTRLQATRTSASGTAQEIVDAHLELLDDPELTESALTLVADGSSAAYAWRQAIRGSIESLRALGDPRMAERVDDLLDLERQVLLALTGNAGAATQELPADAIVLAEELLPSQIVALDAARLVGIALAAGGATSHVSILAAAMGIPALVALGAAVRRIADGTPLLLDADAGLLHVDPGAERLAATRRQLEHRAAQRAAER
ncbi:MAG: glucose PTS transporter subunit IIA, partial [Steroidobacteraceae bacterium]